MSVCSARVHRDPQRNRLNAQHLTCCARGLKSSIWRGVFPTPRGWLRLRSTVELNGQAEVFKPYLANSDKHFYFQAIASETPTYQSCTPLSGRPLASQRAGAAKEN